MEFITIFKDKWPIKRLCEILKVTESGYFKHVRSSARPPRHTDLLAQIYELLREDEENSNYGVRRIYQYLRLHKDYKGSYSTVYRVCAVCGLRRSQMRLLTAARRGPTAA